ncbi:MAG: hypothetical protein ACOCZS_01170 [Verrucomicrobiota bacterium]
MHSNIMAKVRQAAGAKSDPLRPSGLLPLTKPFMIRKIAIPLAIIMIISIITLISRQNGTLNSDDSKKPADKGVDVALSEQFLHPDEFYNRFNVEQTIDNAFSNEFNQLHKKAYDSADFLISCLHVETDL